MVQTGEQQAIKQAAEQGIRRPLSGRIFRLIVGTAVILGIVSILLTILMFYTEYRFFLIGGQGGASDAGVYGPIRFVLIYLAVMTCVTLAIAFAMKRYAARRIVGPIDRIADAASTYITDKSDGTLDELHFTDLHIHTEDELEHLALVLRDMEQSMQRYVEYLTRVTREKERISTELNLARRIQFHMLPNIFPPYPNRKEFDIYAYMDPAKEVGGDFYDFFLIDEDHLGLVIADVSGKGIPAALFMMMARIMINSMALTGASPGKVLEDVNDKICETNKDNMFVTVWLGVLTISTGHVTGVSAGHEYPYLRKKDGEFEMMKNRRSFVVGGMEGISYKEFEFTMEPGAALFLYTDGLPEASNADNEMFGQERIRFALNEDPEADVKPLLEHMTASVASFVGNEAQFDDLTMMVVKLKEPAD